MSRSDDSDPQAATVDACGETAAAQLLATATDPGSSSACADDGTVRAGAMLAHYRLERKLGEGGMGQVWLATDTALERPVAVKLLNSNIASDSQLRQRFFREARAQARIHHPNVCHIYFIGEERNLLFFAMEYVDGETLQERLEHSGKLAPGEAVELCRQAAAGLREADHHGFIHRDIKPSNLMVDRHGAVKVMDFGLVKPAGADNVSGGSAAAVGLTGTRGDGALMGTPLYISPEQAKQVEVDFRADIYSLGATLHHLMSGTPPFSGNSAMAVIAQHLGDPRPLIAGRRRGPYDALLDRMMAKRPADRFASYEELLAAMEGMSPSVTKPAGVWVRGAALVADLLVAQLLLMGVLWGASVVAPVALEILRHGLGFWLVWLCYVVGFNLWWGGTAGKLLLEIEVVAVDKPGGLGLRRAAIRFAVQWGPPMVVNAIAVWATYLEIDLLARLDDLGTFAMLLWIAGAGVLAAWRHPHSRALWDRSSGTQVRYRRAG